MAPGRRADRGNVTRSGGRRAEGRGLRPRADTGQTTKGYGGLRMEISFYFVLVPPYFFRWPRCQIICTIIGSPHVLRLVYFERNVKADSD